jgi:hypothetical protein
MARPQNPITEPGPVADLARELRAARERAGIPAPTYRELAKKAHRSASVLADAASGHRCPTWEVTRSFLSACGADPEALRELWSEADKSDRARKRVRPSPQPELAAVRRLRRQPNSRPSSADPRLMREPDPWDARSPAEYVHKLRTLRAWAGQPGWYEIARRSSSSSRRYMSKSSMYSALNPKRTSLPPLDIVRVIAEGCEADAGEWVSAWRAIKIRELEAQTSRSDDPLGPAAGLDSETEVVRRLKRPGH